MTRTEFLKTPEDWERVARAQSRKLQVALSVPGVKEALASLDWKEGDPTAGWDFVRVPTPSKGDC